MNEIKKNKKKVDKARESNEITGKREKLGDFLERGRAVDPENYLTFIDGVLVTWRIFDRILKKRLTDENGEPEKDNNGCDYLGIINDDLTDMLLTSVLEHGYFKTRGYQLMFQFGIDI